MGYSAKRFLLLSFLLSCLSLSNLMAVAGADSSQSGWCEKLKPCQLLGQSEAERILGRPARLIQSTSEMKGDVRRCGCAYAGVSNDRASGQADTLYFLLEQREGSLSAEQARQVLASTKNENAHDLSIKDISGIGEEAFLLSDESSLDSCFLMARKGGVVIRLQIKKAEKSSVEELKSFAREVAKRL